ncbi:DUF3012 domain-containing protein [Marinobacterium lutimaris]|uniref:DUF3012 domain-containing protein n=1 Tax=Marinobacterium lutimaris TaxID=568106 RepID=A0A1H6C6L7_9GAMM|nr:DUF3012 domain-containing protein [Marinobacterium lutimaris]SEG68611.1 Protein of unknown function [Marinobacterium lutimaris]
MKAMLKGLKTTSFLTLLLSAAVALSACSPEVGSEEWCTDMKEKPKGEWTANELADFTKHCLIP